MSMDVLDAIQSRKSVRAFKPDPVPKETIEKILEVSQRAPSGTNTQPWHTYVCTGAVQQAISDDVIEMAKSGGGKKYEDYDYYPEKWKDYHNARRREVGWGLYGLLGIEKGDREGSTRQALRNFLFFDAPVGIFVTTEKYLTKGSWSDTGMYIQTIMLAAKGFGLDTCPQAAWIPYQEPVLKHLGVPDDQILVSGLSLGFADATKIENTLMSVREPVEDVVRWRGFD